MTGTFDVIVAGIGGMGSAAAFHLARRGLRVLGLEQFDIPHDLGSSHGVNRIIRMAYAEHPGYVPLLRRSYELWRELGTLAGEQILYVTGGLDISADGDGSQFQRSRYSCEVNGLDHETLDAAELMRRFPAIRVPDDYHAVYQPDGGFVLSERGIVAHVEQAHRHGAVIHAREPLVSWEADGDGVRVTTARGTYSAARLVITAGAWANKLLDVLKPGLAVPERQVLAWLQPTQPELFALGALPVWILDAPEGVFYGFPVYGIPGFKFGRMHHREQRVDPDTIDRTPDAADEALLRGFAGRYFPGGAGPTMTLKACMFTNTPDEHFILDRHPEFPQVVFGAGFSGHGYKFCPVIGEVLADLAMDGHSPHPVDWLGVGRFAD